MKKFILVFTLLVSQVYALTLDDLISYKNEVQIVNRRVNEVRFEFKLIEKISNTSGVFEVIRYDKIKEENEARENKLRRRAERNYNGNYNYNKWSSDNRRNRQRWNINRTREMREDKALEENRRTINNVTQNVNQHQIILIEDINLKNSIIDEIFKFDNKLLYRIESCKWNGRLIYKFTFSKEKAKKFIRNNK